MNNKFYPIIILIISSLFVSINSTIEFSNLTLKSNPQDFFNYNNSTISNSKQSSDSTTLSKEFHSNAITYTNSTTVYATLYYTDSEIIWLFEDIPFNSSNYYVEIFEYYNPDFINVDLFIKFESIPTINDYDYCSTSLSSEKEVICIEAPKEKDYGDLYILAYCTSGSGSISMNSWYVLDFNGCWRTADEIPTPINGETIFTKSDNVSSTDKNDFYKIFLYSGQILSINSQVTSIWGSNQVDLYLYDENFNLLEIDSSGFNLNIEFNITISENQFYYITYKFSEIVNGTHFYNFNITDLNVDRDNLFNSPFLPKMNIDGIYYGSMNNSDFNDYWIFYANSGELISINIAIIDEDIEAPYYDAFIFTTDGQKLSDSCATKDSGGTNLNLTYYCGEYNSTETYVGSKNLVFLRLWNAARKLEVNDTASYIISIIHKGWVSNDDSMFSSEEYISNYSNDTKYKQADLSYSYDINDFYKINTTLGFNIKISVLKFNLYENPIWGILYDMTGNILAQEFIGNISISYIAAYSGIYYFRTYEYSASEMNNSYTGKHNYHFFIYTCQIDSTNNDFSQAQIIELNQIIYSDVNLYDKIDVFSFCLESGFVFALEFNFIEKLDVYFYNSSLSQILDYSIEKNIFSFQNVAYEDQEFFIYINNTYESELVAYTLNVNYVLYENDDSIYFAQHIPILNINPISGEDSISIIDINDYYYFFLKTNEYLNLTINSTTNLLAVIIQEVNKTRIQIYENIINDNGIINFYFSGSVSKTIDNKFYLRLYNPNGTSYGNYSWILEKTIIATNTFPEFWFWTTLSVLTFSSLILIIFFIIKRKKKS